ncbi:MAG: DUF839 domain-containing protein [Planctomycetota bacterium]|nr:DUF839 domain-containing protein [Planctomycetota bacterium]
MSLSRRHFLHRGAAFALGFGGLHALMGMGPRALAGFAGRGVGPGSSPAAGVGYGPLVRDPRRIFDLPAGFSYTIISRAGERMDDGLLVPGLHDGMAAFPGASAEETILIRNHEVSPDGFNHSPFGRAGELLSRVDRVKLYDAGGGVAPALGGTTTIVFNTRERKVKKHFLSLGGTVRNCAGGPTPWGSWLSCEEDVTRAGERVSRDNDATLERDHGYVFEVPASSEGLVDPKPIIAMGRFNHEAVAVDPKSGIVYQTEDRGDGLIYRYIPADRQNLLAGGKLQVLVVKGRPSLDTRNWQSPTVKIGEKLAVEWMDIDDVEAPKDDLRQRGSAGGAAVFARGEGMWYGRESVYFACTNGGAGQVGQIWRYTPSEFEGTSGEKETPGVLELFVEAAKAGPIENADNITVAPWGDLVVCEDGNDDDYLHGITPTGQIYPLGHNVGSDSELAGATFSPDGSTLFVNLQTAGMTLAIQGPWRGA